MWSPQPGLRACRRRERGPQRDKGKKDSSVRSATRAWESGPGWARVAVAPGVAGTPTRLRGSLAVDPRCGRLEPLWRQTP